MGSFIVNGGEALVGEIDINGAKNAALPILCACLLNSGITVLNNVPNLTDTRTAIDILRSLGCKVTSYSKTVIIDATFLTSCKIPKELTEKMRSSIIFLGSILARLGEAEIAYPGGCLLGKRPIDLHISALKALGAEIEEEEDNISAKASELVGAEIRLKFPSVGATQNAILAAVLAKGETIIYNSAREPEIEDLCGFLNAMGAKIKGGGSDKIIIQGVDSLHSCEYSIMPDRIEAGTYMCAAVATKGNIILNNVREEHLESLSSILIKMGAELTMLKDKIIIRSGKRLNAVPFVETAPYPLFPTDMQAQLMAVLATAKGDSIIKENIFEARNRHAIELNKMGADIKVIGGREFIIRGVESLKAEEVAAYDLRGGAAMIIAALGCQGQSKITSAEYVLRGYENLDGVINSLGGKIEYVE